MTAFAYRLDDAQDVSYADIERPRLEVIRFAALECRIARKATPETLCGLIGQSAVEPGESFLRALLRLLPVALDRPMVFRRPGAKEPTFDEAWLMRLLTSIERRDTDSLIFALSSRVPRHFHGQVKFLAAKVAENA
ncbi:MAG: hypothetical protein AAF501_06580 [Pseudomonadota bacterium]